MDSILFIEDSHWNGNHRTMIEVFDSQYEKLFSIFNAISIESDTEKIDRLLDELLHYASSQFCLEEVFWSKYFINDSVYHAHELSHNYIVDCIFGLKWKNKHMLSENIHDEIVAFLSKWFKFHILGTDQEMLGAVDLLKKGEASESLLINTDQYWEQELRHIWNRDLKYRLLQS